MESYICQYEIQWKPTIWASCCFSVLCSLFSSLTVLRVWSKAFAFIIHSSYKMKYWCLGWDFLLVLQLSVYNIWHKIANKCSVYLKYKLELSLFRKTILALQNSPYKKSWNVYFVKTKHVERLARCALGNFLSWETANSLTQPILVLLHAAHDQAAWREMPGYH